MSGLCCTTVGCKSDAERVLALKLAIASCVFVAPYCVAHGDALVQEGRGVFAAGPALSDEAAQIEGIRR